VLKANKEMALIESPKNKEVVVSKPKEMSFFDHLDELRKHIIRSIIAMILAGIIIFLNKDYVFDQIIFVAKRPDFAFYRFTCWLSDALALGKTLCMGPVNFELITTQLGEAFILHLKVSLIGGFVVAFPYVFWEFWRFISPGLLPEEQKSTRGVVFVCSFLFMCGILFGYFVVSPFAVNFLAGYSINQVNSTVTISSYVNYMIMFTVPTGLAFEMPLVIYYLAKVGLITADFMRKYRRHAVVVLLITAAIITPPDMITQILIGMPLYILYELSIFIAAREEKKREISLR